MSDLDPRLHFVAVTCIIEKKGDDGVSRFLITKRAPTEKAWPNKWTVPGGKFVYTEYKDLPRSSINEAQWYNVMEFVLRKEVREEVGLEVGTPDYVTNLVAVRPDGYPVVVFSFWAPYKSGEVKLSHEMTDFAWVTSEEARRYDMIDGIPDEIAEVEKRLV
jgi:8-oxo-dGTP pyrophosphatase MutT (NUDIX family)